MFSGPAESPRPSRVGGLSGTPGLQSPSSSPFMQRALSLSRKSSVTDSPRSVKRCIVANCTNASASRRGYCFLHANLEESQVTRIASYCAFLPSHASPYCLFVSCLLGFCVFPSQHFCLPLFLNCLHISISVSATPWAS